MAAPTRAELARSIRRALQENLGQPGFRELLVTVHDLDAWRDLVFALLGRRIAGDSSRARWRPRCPPFRGVRSGGVARDHLGDALVAALFGAARDRTHPPGFRWKDRGAVSTSPLRSTGCARSLDRRGRAGWRRAADRRGSFRGRREAARNEWRARRSSRAHRRAAGRLRSGLFT